MEVTRLKQPRCPSTSKLLNNLWYIYILDDHLAIKWKELIVNSVSWIISRELCWVRKKKRKFSKMLHILWSIDMIFNKWTKLKKWRAGDWLPGIRETRRREVGVAVKRQHEWFSWWRKWSVSCLHQFQYSGCGLLLQSYKLSPFEENLVKNTESKDHPQSLCIMNVNTNLQLSQNNKFH